MQHNLHFYLPFTALEKAAVEMSGGIAAVAAELVNQYKMDPQKLDRLEKLQSQDAGVCVT